MIANLIVFLGSAVLVILPTMSCGTPSKPQSLVVPVKVLSPDASVALDLVSEVEARALLNSLFREAGLRVVNDYRWQNSVIEVTLDGYDPERGVGYEYIDTAEHGTDIDLAESDALRKCTGILVLGALQFSELESRARVFLNQQRVLEANNIQGSDC